MAALDLTGTWAGTWACKDVTSGAAQKPGGALTMTVTQSGDDVYAFIDYDGSGTSSFQGHVGELTDKPGQGASTLIACSTRAGSDQYGETLSAKVKVNQDKPIKATLKGTSAYEGSAPFPSVGGTCKYSLKRTALADPLVDGCALPGYGARFVDNGLTVTDNLTHLEWEKKDGAGGGANLANPHDVDNTYSWTVSGSPYPPDGTAFTSFLAKLNDGGGNSCPTGGPEGGCCPNSTCTDVDCFAGNCDWRLPTIVELQTILLAPCETSHCIDPVFGPTAVAVSYWSATTFATNPFYAWFVGFNDGFVGFGLKVNGNYVRAVRSGS